MLAGCGGSGASKQDEPCSTLLGVRSITSSRDAVPTLRRIVDAEAKLPDSAAGGAALAEARRTLANVSADALDTTLMSPAHTIVRSTNHVVDVAHALCR